MQNSCLLGGSMNLSVLTLSAPLVKPPRSIYSTVLYSSSTALSLPARVAQFRATHPPQYRTNLTNFPTWLHLVKHVTQLCTLASEKSVIGIIRPCYRLRHAPTSTCKAEHVI